MSVFNDPTIDEITIEDLNHYPVIRYGTPSGFYIDLITKLGEFASFNTLESEVIHFEGVPIRIATANSLYELKCDTIRPRDRADALFLKELIESKNNDLDDADDRS